MSKHTATTIAAAITDETINPEIKAVLLQVSPTAIVEFGKTSLMDGDHIATVQDTTVSIWYSVSGSPADAIANASRCTPNEYYRYNDAGCHGGLVRDLPDGRSVADIGDGSGQYLDISNGSVLDYI